MRGSRAAGEREPARLGVRAPWGEVRRTGATARVQYRAYFEHTMSEQANGAHAEQAHQPRRPSCLASYVPRRAALRISRSNKVTSRTVGPPDRDFPRVSDDREATYSTSESAVLREMNERTQVLVCNDEMRFHLVECRGSLRARAVIPWAWDSGAAPHGSRPRSPDPRPRGHTPPRPPSVQFPASSPG